METIPGSGNWKLTIRREAAGITILRAATCDARARLPETLYGLPVTALGDHALSPTAASAEGEDLLVACGTVSTTALPQLQAENDLPMVGVVEPTCRRAVLMTQNKRVGLIATAASVRSGAYEAALRRLDPEVTVFSRACPLFVPLAEAGRIRRGDVVIETVAREYLTPLKNAGVDTLILGCTHYPLLTDVIGDVMGPGVELVSAGEESAFELKRMLKARELRADERRRGETEFYVSDRVEDFERTASLFLQEDLRHTARRIDIERY